jgi:putative N6-adenine-specific DNA methylase
MEYHRLCDKQQRTSSHSWSILTTTVAEIFFAPCPRGLEQTLVAELTEIGVPGCIASDAGVQFVADFERCYAANLHSRIASRVLWRVACEAYRNEDDVYAAAAALPWADWFSVERTIRVSVNAIKCPLKSLDFLALRIKDAVCDKFRAAVGSRPSVDTRTPDIRIHAFLDPTRLTLYVDTSGEALFKRGQRKEAGEAPIKENLAAGMLRLAGWEPGIALLDPMCGSGTILLQAAQMALRIAPGHKRAFAFEKLRNFDSQAWHTLRAEAESRIKPVEALQIYGSDLYGDVLKNARENLAAAGLQGAVQLKQANLLEISAPAANGILVTNPPYGVRLGDDEALARLYPLLGDLLKKKFAGWRAYILTSDMRLPKLIRLTTSRRIPLFNAQLECRLFEYKLVAGTMRKG